MPFSPAYHFDPDSNLAALNRVSSRLSIIFIARNHFHQPIYVSRLTKRRKEDVSSASSINMKK